MTNQRRRYRPHLRPAVRPESPISATPQENQAADHTLSAKSQEPAFSTPPAAAEPTQEDLEEQIILKALEEHRAGLPVSDDVKLLAELYDDIPRMEALLAQQEPALEEREQQEAGRTKTPLSLKLEVTSCRFATVIFPDGKTMPEFIFDRPCVMGKDRPDLDCRHCIHHRILPYGATQPAHHNRYEGHGMVMPVADEQSAEKLANVINVLGMNPLVSPRLILQALKRNLETARNRCYEARRRELERRQWERTHPFGA
jgi:hypothetical protein